MEFMKKHKVESYLEIGTRCGSVNKYIRQETGVRAVAVDMPGGPWGSLKYVEALKQNMAGCTLILGDSTSPEVIAQARAEGPYDLIFIDGDHSSEGVRADWDNYHDMAKYVAFHDILSYNHNPSSGKDMGVRVFWAELKEEYETEECQGPDSLMGIGIVKL